MGRIRSIKPAFFRHEELQALGPIPMLFFGGLWTAADREGRFRWDPKQLRLDILPFMEFSTEEVLETLWRAGFLVKYHSGGRAFGWIPSWKDHQAINLREAASVLPDPDEPGSARASTDVPALDHMQASVPARALTAGREGKGIGREREREGEGEGKAAEPSAPSPVPLAVGLVSAVIEDWNAMAEKAGLPQCRGSEKVRATIRIRLKEPGWLEALPMALAYTAGSGWTKGKNDRGWKADLEWLLSSGNVQRYAKAPEGPLASASGRDQADAAWEEQHGAAESQAQLDFEERLKEEGTPA